MPLLAALLKSALTWLGTVGIILTESKQAIRIGFALGMASAYTLCVLGFTTFIAPLIGALFSTSYGQVIGMAFPPIAGTIIVGLGSLWACIVANNYYKTFGTLALPH